MIQELDFVSDAEVYGEKNLLLGNIVCARIRLDQKIIIEDFKENIKSYCRKKLDPFKVPVKIRLAKEDLYSFRFKKMRSHEI